MSEEYHYLQAGFDPTSLKVADLRRIFFEFDVDFKSSAKKAELVQLFNDEIRSRSKELLQLRTRSSPSKNTVELVGDAIPRTNPRRATRTAEQDVASHSEISIDYITMRNLSDKGSPEPQSQTRLTPRPVMKKESTFSLDNPFQSGSPEAPAKSPSKRRQTTQPSFGNDLAPAISSQSLRGVRRRTETPLTPVSIRDQPVMPHSRNNFMTPVEELHTSPAFRSVVRRRKLDEDVALQQLMGGSPHDSSTDGELDSNEEFTPDESVEVALERKKEKLRRHTRNSLSKSSLSVISLPIALVLSLALALSWYRTQTIRAGYCEINTDRASDSSGDLLDFIRPTCQPCPPHAICGPGLRAECEDGFNLVYHPLSFGGIVPVAPECVPDTEKLRRISVVSEEITETLRDRTAELECGYKKLHKGEEKGLTEEALRERLYEKKSDAISDTEFETLFTHALEEVSTKDEIEVTRT